jgi:hypothetical protein
MSQANVKPIWNAETGILDLEGDPETLSASEIPGIKAVWTDQRTRLEGTRQLSDFTERLAREWAIETGVIENLYDIERGVTQTLIERGFQAELLSHGSTNRPREYVLQLLRDQKDALDGVFDFISSKRALSVSYIKELHAALLRSQATTEGVDAQGRIVEIPLIKGDWKVQPNYPVRDGVTYTYCAPEHVAAEMDRLVSVHADQIKTAVPSEVQAAWLHHRFTQIHPFQDGNGRVARAIASLVLVKGGLFPLVVTRDDKPLYLDALEAADDGCLKPLIDLIAKLQLTQFRKATAVSDEVLAQDSVAAILGGPMTAANTVPDEKDRSFRDVFTLANGLEEDIEARLGAIVPGVEAALRRDSPTGTAVVTRSTGDTSHFFRAQIVENAKSHLRYHADTSGYRSWVALDMIWSRRARLVFAFHGLGKPFNGSLICAPFLEFLDTDERAQVRSALAPVADDGFVFFYTEGKARLLERFMPWREGVLNVALTELTRNL